MTTQTLTLADFLLARIGEDESHMQYMADYVVDRPTLAEHALADSYSRRVLAECEAKRQIVGIHPERSSGRVCNADDDLYPCETLRALALPYADHPSFRDEWASSAALGSPATS